VYRICVLFLKYQLSSDCLSSVHPFSAAPQPVAPEMKVNVENSLGRERITTSEGPMLNTKLQQVVLLHPQHNALLLCLFIFTFRIIVTAV